MEDQEWPVTSLDKFDIGVLVAVEHSITGSLADRLRVVLVVVVVQVYRMVSHVDHQVVIHQVAWAVDKP